jgi:hypothetical protein
MYMISQDKLETIRDFRKFAERFLIVKSKAAQKKLFQFNRAQLFLHERLARQKELTGRVRAVILKGRQQGCSTYIQARFFHQIITSRGKKAFILTHDKDATNNLFNMAKRFQENLEPGLAPKPNTDNAKELNFKQLDSGYAIGTAGNKAVGRSQTIQLFHGSEVGYWSFAEEHAKGVMEAISNDVGTEIILESTANGIGNYFHQKWLTGMSPDSEYQSIFLPWYWNEEYTNDATNMKLSIEEEELMKSYSSSGLTIENLSWRRMKIAGYSKDYDAGKESFQSQYPFNSIEAFKNPVHNIFINGKYVSIARNNKVEHGSKLIIGVDVAMSEQNIGDRTAIIRRRGRCAYNLERISYSNAMEIAGKLKRIITEEKPDKIYVDAIGMGGPIVDRLNEMGYDIVEGIKVSRNANDKERYKNLRAELWGDMRDWLYQDMDVQIPDEDELHGELCSLGFKENSSGQIQIESKDDLRARGLPSPDGADALCLTFAGGFHGVQSAIEVPKLYPHERGTFR